MPFYIGFQQHRQCVSVCEVLCVSPRDRPKNTKRMRRGKCVRGICLNENKTTILSTTLPLAQPFTSHLVYPHTQGYITLLSSYDFTLRRSPSMKMAGNCTDSFWYTQKLYFQRTFPSHMRHGIGTIMTRYATGRTEIHLGLSMSVFW
jgi:hypothetical protein